MVRYANCELYTIDFELYSTFIKGNQKYIMIIIKIFLVCLNLISGVRESLVKWFSGKYKYTHDVHMIKWFFSFLVISLSIFFFSSSSCERICIFLLCDRRVMKISKKPAIMWTNSWLHWFNHFYRLHTLIHRPLGSCQDETQKLEVLSHL